MPDLLTREKCSPSEFQGGQFRSTGGSALRGAEVTKVPSSQGSITSQALSHPKGQRSLRRSAAISEALALYSLKQPCGRLTRQHGLRKAVRLLLSTKWEPGLGDDSQVGSSRGARSSSQHLHGGSHPLAPSVLEDLMLSSSLYRHQTYKGCTETLVHIKLEE